MISESSLPDVLTVGGSTLTLREAVEGDVPALVQLLADDQLGATRDGAAGEDDLQPYVRAFHLIDADSAHLLLVATSNGDVIATMQLEPAARACTAGSPRAQIEAVRVRADYRSRGLGAALLEWAIAEAQRRGCTLLQLTTDKSRVGAHRFYERLGFVASHEGLKLHL